MPPWAVYFRLPPTSVTQFEVAPRPYCACCGAVSSHEVLCVILLAGEVDIPECWMSASHLAAPRRLSVCFVLVAAVMSVRAEYEFLEFMAEQWQGGIRGSFKGNPSESAWIMKGSNSLLLQTWFLWCFRDPSFYSHDCTDWLWADAKARDWREERLNSEFLARTAGSKIKCT